MCSLFWKRMDNDQGDLADIVRASGGTTGFNNQITDWQFPVEPMNFPVGIDDPNIDFGDPPISNIHDPLLHELGIGSSLFFNSSNSTTENLSMMVTENENVGHMVLNQETKPYQLFSKMLQISPKSSMGITGNNSSSSSSPSPRGGSKSAGVNGEMIKNNNSLCAVENGSSQLSSQRNTGIKRRKSQMKKVVCIPAPAAANSSRPSGEVVPSDLWAWRKYGQKPIKGSPYPRGYYRCSSSKGCSARKQVERSRTDPNMLVITYTSEHNHPWPTQRNALAGSTRSQPLKSSSSSKNSNSSPHMASKPAATVKEEKDTNNSPPTMAGGQPAKEEMDEDENTKNSAMEEDQEFEESFHHTYRPVPPDQNQQTDDFFAELGELEDDPVSLMFSQEFTEEKNESKALDPFHLFDWSG